MSLQPLVDVGENRRNLSSMYAPIAADLTAAERVFQHELGVDSRSYNSSSIIVATIEAKGCVRPSYSSREKRAACSRTFIPSWRPSSR